MKTNNSTGRNVSIALGVWLIIKVVINSLIGGGLDISGLIIAIIGTVLLYVGIKYTNYVIAAALALVVIVNLPNNIGMIFSSDIFKGLIYILEGAVDLVGAILICASANVREHFSNTISDLSGGNQ